MERHGERQAGNERDLRQHRQGEQQFEQDDGPCHRAKQSRPRRPAPGRLADRVDGEREHIHERATGSPIPVNDLGPSGLEVGKDRLERQIAENILLPGFVRREMGRADAHDQQHAQEVAAAVIGSLKAPEDEQHVDEQGDGNPLALHSREQKQAQDQANKIGRSHAWQPGDPQN